MDHTAPKMSMPSPDELLAYRDGIYASDLLICAVAHFDFFSRMAEAPVSNGDLRQATGITERPLDVLLTLSRSRGLVSQEGQGFSLTPLARQYLISSAPQSLVPYYSSLGTRPQCLEFRDILTTDRPAGWASGDRRSRWLESMGEPAFADAFTSAMNSRGALLGDRLAERLDCSDYSALLDIGGGSGVYARRLAASQPDLRATVLEISPVDRAATRAISASGMSSRVQVEAGDMFAAIPAGYDLHLFANVFHDWDVDSLHTLCRRSHEALTPGGAVVIFDAHLNASKDGPLLVAEYSCLIMHSTAGRCYSTAEVSDALHSAGFGRISVKSVDPVRSIVQGRKG